MGKKSDDLISTADAARVLKLSAQQVRAHARNGSLRGVMVGRDWVFRRGDVRAFKPPPRGRPKEAKKGTRR